MQRYTTTNIVGFLAFVVAIGVLNACAGTRAAYDSATTLDAKAYVVSEHYAALVREANDLADQPGFPPARLAQLQAADSAAKPLVLELRSAAQTYTALRSAENEAALQEALNKAVLQVSAFITVIRNR